MLQEGCQVSHEIIFIKGSMKYKVLNKPYLVGHSCSDDTLFKRSILVFYLKKKKSSLNKLSIQKLLRLDLMNSL